MCGGRRGVKIVNGSLNTWPWVIIKLLHVVVTDIGRLHVVVTDIVRCDSRGLHDDKNG